MVSFQPHEENVAPVVSLTEHRQKSAESESEQSVDVDLGAYESVATRALARRDLSRKELGDYLADRGAARSTCDVVIDRLKELGYVDDSRVAAEIVRRRVERQGKTRKVVFRELLSRGINSATAEEALTAVDSDVERSSAFQLAEKRARQIHGADENAVVRRLSAFLLRRGYDGDVVREAVDHARSSVRTGVHFR